MIGVTKNKKKWQAYYIAPLQPPTLAVFRPWGSSAGAGRVRPADAKIRKQDKSQKMNSKNYVERRKSAQTGPSLQGINLGVADEFICTGTEWTIIN